jgi:hypothetical protein
MITEYNIDCLSLQYLQQLHYLRPQTPLDNRSLNTTGITYGRRKCVLIIVSSVSETSAVPCLKYQGGKANRSSTSVIWSPHHDKSSCHIWYVKCEISVLLKPVKTSV